MATYKQPRERGTEDAEFRPVRRRKKKRKAPQRSWSGEVLRLFVYGGLGAGAYGLFLRHRRRSSTILLPVTPAIGDAIYSVVKLRRINAVRVVQNAETFTLATLPVGVFGFAALPLKSTTPVVGTSGPERVEVHRTIRGLRLIGYTGPTLTGNRPLTLTTEGELPGLPERLRIEVTNNSTVESHHAVAVPLSRVEKVTQAAPDSFYVDIGPAKTLLTRGLAP